MAIVAKWLRQRFVVSPFVGSSPIGRPFTVNSEQLTNQLFLWRITLLVMRFVIFYGL